MKPDPGSGAAPTIVPDPYAVLRVREYRAYLASVAAVSLATQVQSAVLGWQVYAITRDPLSLGLVGLSEAVPFLTLTLVGGWAADRFDRRRLVLLALALVGAAGAWLLAVSVGGARSALPFYAAQALAGTGRAFFRPASWALGTELVPREAYHNAATWRSATFHVATVLGPAAGGALIAFGGPRTAYAVVVSLFAVGIAAMAAIPVQSRSPPPPGGRMIHELVDGVRFVFREQLLLGAMSLDMFAVLFGGATALLPVFARDVLGVHEVGFGLLRAAPAAGSIVMSLTLARLGHFRRAGRALLWAVALFGLSWMAFGLSRWFALSLAILAVGGALDSVSIVLRSTLIQSFTPQEKMGRVAAVNGLFIGSSNELGAFESGVAAKLVGVVPSVLLGGALTLVTVGMVAWRAPRLRRLGRIEAGG